MVLVLVGGVVALIVGLSALFESDEEAIERVTNACRLAVLDGNVEAVFDRLTDDAVYVHGKRERPLATEVRERVAQVQRRANNISLTLRRIEVDGDDARATWQVFVRMRPGERFPVGRFDVRVGYRRGPSDWKVARVEMSAP
jgi:ketosteroid isomerase-like protein